MAIMMSVDICCMKRISLDAWLITIILFSLVPSALLDTSHVCAGVTVNIQDI